MSVEPAGRRIPLWLKLAYTGFMAIVIPYYWRVYGPTNFLYFCDVAILVTLVAIWTENRLLASMQAVAIIVPQTLWVIDFVLMGTAGRSVLGLADYMYNPRIPLFGRCLSSFHGWLPFLLVWMVWRLGYDRRALAVQTLCCWALLLICFFFTPCPPAPADDPNAAVNVNYVFGLGDSVQTWMPPGLWLALLMVVLPLLIYWPTHLVLRRAFPGHHRPGEAY